jgi:hypothetical protein
MEEGAATDGAAAEGVGEGVGTRLSLTLSPPLAKATIRTTTTIRKIIPPNITNGFL